MSKREVNTLIAVHFVFKDLSKKYSTRGDLNVFKYKKGRFYRMFCLFVDFPLKLHKALYMFCGIYVGVLHLWSDISPS